MRKGHLILVTAACALIVARPAHAYLDPATGSIVLQAVLAGIAGAALALKTFWHRIKGRLGRADPRGDIGDLDDR